MANRDLLSGVRLKVGRDVFDARLRHLITEAQNLHAYGAGPQPEANRAVRQRFLAWMAEVERSLDWAIQGVDLAVSLQTPRLLSIVEDRVPDLELFRAVDSENRMKVAVLSDLLNAEDDDRDEHDGDQAAPPSRSPATQAPRVFLSHASEDKDRFVVGFARKLRSSGIDAWLDRWELQPGDSLVDRIFEQGIGEADAFIIVLSENSIDKRWVHEELNAAVVRRIGEGTRLIPILIDDVTVPQALRSTVWIKVESVASYDTELDEVVRTIFGHTHKPALGPPPSWVHPTVVIASLGPSDSSVLSLAAEQALINGHRFLDTSRLIQACAQAGISTDGCIESLSALGHADLLEVELRSPPTISRVEITNYGLETFLDATRSDLRDIQQRVIAELLNQPDDAFPVEGAVLVENVGEAELLVEVLLDALHSRDLITLAKYLGNTMRVHHVSPLLRRELD